MKTLTYYADCNKDTGVKVAKTENTEILLDLRASFYKALQNIKYYRII